MATRKKIQIISQNGSPVIGAHVLNASNKRTGTITNLDGIATVYAAENDVIKISHVSGASKEFQFQNLPEVIELEANELDETVVTANKPKTANLGVFALLIALGIGGYFMYNKNKS